MNDPGDHRLSRLWHYHRPGGLNGRVRNGNGCGPAGMVAEEPTARRIQAVRPGVSVGSWTTLQAESWRTRADWIRHVLRLLPCDRSHSHTYGRDCGMHSLRTRERPCRWVHQRYALALNSKGEFIRPLDRSGALLNRRRVGVVKSLGCWDRSAATIARRALPAHRPGRLPGTF